MFFFLLHNYYHILILDFVFRTLYLSIKSENYLKAKMLTINNFIGKDDFDINPTVFENGNVFPNL